MSATGSCGEGCPDLNKFESDQMGAFNGWAARNDNSRLQRFPPASGSKSELHPYWPDDGIYGTSPQGDRQVRLEREHLFNAVEERPSSRGGGNRTTTARLSDSAHGGGVVSLPSLDPPESLARAAPIAIQDI